MAATATATPTPIPIGFTKAKGQRQSVVSRNLRCVKAEKQGLPPGILVGAVRSAWSTGWKLMMKQLAPSDRRGEYTRPDSAFRGCPEEGDVVQHSSPRYHLYAALECPWAHRALIVRALKGLHHALPLSVASPGINGLWEFRGTNDNDNDNDVVGKLRPTADKLHGRNTLRDVYRQRKGGYKGRATVPMLWDTLTNDVVNNESADIIQILNSNFNTVATNPQLDLSPPSLADPIREWNNIIFPNINNGVYRCGFAQSQDAYETAVDCLFDTLDTLEAHLASSRYLCGEFLTLADVRLFTTMFRFDPVYHILFKCSKKKLSEYPNLYGYMLDIYQMPGVASTCDLQVIMGGYYRTLFPLNPGSIQPVIPLSYEFEALNKDHNREFISLSL
ncbi:hypothetical protein SUGI_0615560 [Cryptomeria japonica]|uniref:uncharacterized protein LOC131031589 isoform X2 n=1 Tax=Cryptomeria japonica TaxID=3369 RepID=UPI002414A944|nr:uncharacterized protein LOC131031589 isoform X2 [Cryptomeria japonica]GLJ30915.1 hypothetical protein SUGI_0615560 [Cryptomeria japonica]